MAIHSTEGHPADKPEQRFRAWVRCEASPPDSRDPCPARSKTAYGWNALEAKRAASDVALSGGWSVNNAGKWFCPLCTKDVRGTSRPDVAAPDLDLDLDLRGRPVQLMAPGPTGPVVPSDRDAPPRYLPDQVHDIPVGDLMPDPHQPRKLFDEPALDALARSLRQAGQQQPIRFRERISPPPHEAPLILVDGERRWRAARMAGLATVRGILDTADDAGAALIARQALLNEPGVALTAWDWVLTFRYLASEKGMGPADIAAELNLRGVTTPSGKPWGRPQVSNYLRLLELPAWAQDLISDGRLTPSHGLYLLPAKDRGKVISDIQSWLRNVLPQTTSPADTEHTDPDDTPRRRPLSVALLRDELVRLHQVHYYQIGAELLRGGRWLTRFAPDGDASKCPGCRLRADFAGRSYCMDAATDWLCFRTHSAAAAAAGKLQGPHATGGDRDTGAGAGQRERALLRSSLEPEVPAAPPEVVSQKAAPAHPAETTYPIGETLAPSGDIPPTAPPAAYRRPTAADYEARERRAAQHDAQIKDALAAADVPQLHALLLWALLRREYMIVAREASAVPKPQEIAERLASDRAHRFLRSRTATVFERTLNDSDRAVIAEYLGLDLTGGEG